MDKLNSLFLHEAGHYVVARSLGIRVDRLFFEYDSSPSGQLYYRGVTKFLPQRIAGTEETIRYCKARIIVLMAGTVSQHLYKWEDEVRIEKQDAINSIESSDNSDFWKTRELLMMLVGLIEENVNNYDENQINDIYGRVYSEIFERTCVIVLENSLIINELVMHIHHVCNDGGTFVVNKDSLEEMPFLAGVKPTDP